MEAVAEKKGPSLKRSASVVGLYTLLSRLLGFLRDMLTASYLGAGFYSDAFFVAFRLPNLFRRLFGEGCLTVSFVPIFTQLLLQQGKEAAQRFTRSTYSWLLLILLLLVGACIAFAQPLTWLFASGFSPEKLQVTTQLTRIVFPYILLVSLVALTMGVLNSLKHFSTPAFSPVLLNIGMIASLVASPYLPWHPAYVLAVGVLVGGVLQFVLQAFAMAHHHYHLGLVPLKPVQPEIITLGRTMLPGVFGAAAYQINLLINTQLASHLSEGSVSYLNYSDRLIEFPLGLVAVSLSTAILPYLSEQVATQNIEAVKRTMREGLKLLYFLTLPAMIGYIMLRLPITDIIYHRGAFSLHDSEMTAYALLFSSLGLLGVGTLRVTVPVFYAMKDMKTPFYVSLVAMAINLSCALWLMRPLQHGGLALAVSISATCNAIILHLILRRRLGKLGLKAILGGVGKMMVAGILMGLFLWLVQKHYSLMLADKTRVQAALELATVIISASIIYFVACSLLKVEEAQKLLKLIRQRLTRQ